MITYTATVIKTGNSFALRIPKRYAEDAALELGAKVSLPLPYRSRAASLDGKDRQGRQDQQKIQKVLTELQALKPYKAITDSVAWQREIRKDRPLPGRD